MKKDKALERLVATDCLSALLYYRHNLCARPECLSTTDLTRCGGCLESYLEAELDRQEDAASARSLDLLRDWRREHSD